jgi:hypothetical protein
MTFGLVARKPDDAAGKENAIIQTEVADNSASNTSGIVGQCLPSD